MSQAWIGLGGNLGDPLRQMAEALRRLDAGPDMSVEIVSPVYRTPPWGKTDQPDFLNCCAGLRTSLDADSLLMLCLATERALHRERNERWGPRTIDIDLLDHDGTRMRTDSLELPHPRLTERAFVLVPLAEIAPDLQIAGRRVQDLRALVETGGIELFQPGGDWWRQEEPSVSRSTRA
ncbi:2-amino-4-hydroxy-6-hydroxymethyldihydropteridine diphosphokinase [Aureimonas sp. AU40]|uniref:2-amino-4-hydroxy-6- hydroxymethyldihydropteridine diphosphokinase n=1 Tax=Aureimonas sp. AU40 TaxID=1637747 RepID=UPI000784C9C0|nr:2-amino-4-hydroxy-6-hydroxymethyldihydropteridine diphosphokinase [Aureimonas sp. AU40]